MIAGIEKYKTDTNIFLLINISGWLLFALFIYLYNLLVFERSANIIQHFVSFTTGFLCTIVLRLVYRNIFYKTRLAGIPGETLGYSVNKLLGVMLLFSFGAALTWYTIRLHSSILISPPRGYTVYNSLFTEQWLIRHSSGIFWNFITIMVWSGIYFFVKLRQDWNIQVEKTEKAKYLAQHAHMQMLRYQVNPHFLFNSLNTIRALITEDKKCAKEMITELSEFLKYTLVNKEYSNVTLSDEIESVKHYLAIEKKRYEQKLEISFDVEERTLSCSVVSYLIYPVIENAVITGLKSGTLPLKIKLRTSLDAGSLEIKIISNIHTQENGIPEGLQNLKQRLEVNYPAAHSFSISGVNNKTEVVIRIKDNQI